MPVMMRPSLGIGVNMHRPRPEFLCPYASEIYRGGAVHAGGLGGVGVEAVGGDDADAGCFPVGFGGGGGLGWVVVVVGGGFGHGEGGWGSRGRVEMEW